MFFPTITPFNHEKTIKINKNILNWKLFKDYLDEYGLISRNENIDHIDICHNDILLQKRLSYYRETGFSCIGTHIYKKHQKSNSDEYEADLFKNYHQIINDYTNSYNFGRIKNFSINHLIDLCNEFCINDIDKIWHIHISNPSPQYFDYKIRIGITEFGLFIDNHHLGYCGDAKVIYNFNSYSKKTKLKDMSCNFIC